MLKKVMIAIGAGIAWGCMIACMINIIGSVTMGTLWFENMKHGYAIQTLASMISGVGWVLPSLIYQNERISMGLRVMVHMGVGFFVYIICAFWMEWIPTKYGIWPVVICVFLMFAVALLIWFCFYLYHKKEAKNINEKIG